MATIWRQPVAVPARRAWSFGRHRRALTGSAAVGLFLIVWEVVGATNLVRSDLVSFPSEVVASTLAMAGSGELGKNTLVSLSAFVQGFVPAVIGGVALGLVIGLVKPVRLLLDPLLVALYSAPRIAFIPILVVWFGVGAESKVVMVFLSAVFPVMINTTTGVQEVSEPWIRAVRAFGASPMQVVTKAVLPAALPAIMAGVRLGLGRAIVGLIAAEMYVSVAGIGRLVQVYSSAGRATQLIVLVVVISAFGFACVTLLRSVEEWLGPWRQELEQ